MRSFSSRREPTSFRRAPPSATYGSLELGRLPAERKAEQATDELPDRPARRALPGIRVRRIASRCDRSELPGGCEPAKGDHDRRQGHVPDRDQLEDIPRSVEAELEPPSERPEQKCRAQEAQPEHTGAHPGNAVAYLRQPQPGMERREQEDQRERVRREGQ